MVTHVNGTHGIRLTAADKLLLEKLRKKLGIQAVAEILRQGLRALAEKEGIKV